MSSFTKPLVLEFDPNNKEGRYWKTTRRFTYYVGKEDSGDKVMVPKGFNTDLASVPPIARMLIPKSGKYNQAAVVHDYLYHTMERPRKEADKIFLEAMKVLGVPFWKRHVMHKAVRLNFVAERRFRKHAKKNKKVSK